MSESDKTRAAASVRQRLLNLAKLRSENFDLILTRYAMERFLGRLSHSKHRAELILKGAMLFQLWSQTPHRATRDMDFLAQGDASTAAIAEKVQEICAVDVEEDGLTFDLSKLEVHEIREDDHYGGVRAKFTAHLGSARILIQLDFGIGDAVTPKPIETSYPTLLDMSKPSVLAYPRETVIAEKLEAIVDLGMDNSRMKDFFDLWFILTTFDDDPEVLALAVRQTFDRRRQQIPTEIPVGLSDEFASNPDKEKQWVSFVNRAVGAAPSLTDVILAIRGPALRLFKAASK